MDPDICDISASFIFPGVYENVAKLISVFQIEMKMKFLIVFIILRYLSLIEIRQEFLQ